MSTSRILREGKTPEQWVSTLAERGLRVSERTLRERGALKALEPFALVAEYDIGDDETDNDFFRPMERHNRAPRLKVGHLRAARACLEKGN